MNANLITTSRGVHSIVNRSYPRKTLSPISKWKNEPPQYDYYCGHFVLSFLVSVHLRPSSHCEEFPEQQELRVGSEFGPSSSLKSSAPSQKEELVIEKVLLWKTPTWWYLNVAIAMAMVDIRFCSQCISTSQDTSPHFPNNKYYMVDLNFDLDPFYTRPLTPSKKEQAMVQGLDHSLDLELVHLSEEK